MDWESHSLLCDDCVTGENIAVGVAGGIFGDGVAELAPMFAWICAVELLNEDSRFCAEDFLRMPGRLTSTTLVRFMIAVWVDREGNQTLTATSTITMADFAAIAQRFTVVYYNTFDRNRSELSPLYVSHGLEIYRIIRDLNTLFGTYQRDRSMLTWEGSQHLGARSIIEKLSVNYSRHLIPVKRTDTLSSPCHSRRSSTKSPHRMLNRHRTVSTVSSS